MEILRIATAGSVDDGKSTLLGRLLYDTKSIFEDQLAAIQSASQSRGHHEIELALFTDGLRAEREQNITIDVAYRFFSTEKRQYILADTPGHAQYTRNMVTGASTADLAIILIDARKGVLDQSRRHAAIAALLKVPHIIVAVNKMDLVDFDRGVFDCIEAEFAKVSTTLGLPKPQYIPISALLGDNVVNLGSNMPWYKGDSLLEALDAIAVPKVQDCGLRLPIQCVIRPHQDYRGLAGLIESGTVKVGDKIIALPSKKTTEITSVLGPEGEIVSAKSGMPVTVTLSEDLDLSRGDMIASIDGAPSAIHSLQARICWFDEVPAHLHARYIISHTTRQVFGTIASISGKLNVTSLEMEPSEALAMNDVAVVKIHLAKPLFVDTYQNHRILGGFIVIDPHTHRTVGAGMIEEIYEDEISHRKIESGEIYWLANCGAGQIEEIKQALEIGGNRLVVLDDSSLSSGINSDHPDAEEALRRQVEIARLLSRQGHTVLIWSQLEPPITMKKEVVPALSIGITPSSTAPVEDLQIWRILE